jgi:hypothetical protein
VLYCVELFGGIARAQDHLATDGERIPRFLSPYLLPLSGLMDYYADDLFICEQLLSLFCDYSSHCAEFLDDGQRKVLFHASARLLKSYSTRHCTHRAMVIVDAEKDEKSYHDILFAIQLLMSLSTQEFYHSKSSLDGAIDSAQVADVLFFGLQQIMPLMTQGLLQYPKFCQKYFSLLGFAMQSYSCKVDTLPPELVETLVQSLLFGVNHQDRSVAQQCLEGLGNLTKEHLRSGALTCHLSQRRDLLDECTKQIFQKVVFQPLLIWDRLEATSQALLPLAAVHVNRFIAVIHELLVESSAIKNPAQHPCLGLALEKLLAQEVIANVLEEGYEGRINSRRFKEGLEGFVKTVHPLVVFR